MAHGQNGSPRVLTVPGMSIYQQRVFALTTIMPEIKTLNAQAANKRVAALHRSEETEAPRSNSYPRSW